MIYKDSLNEVNSINLDIKKSTKDSVKLDYETFVKTNSSYKEYPDFNPEDATHIVELDNAASYSQLGKLGYIPHWLKFEDMNFEDLNDPFTIDFKASPETWLKKQIEIILNEYFNTRRLVEKNLSRNELECFDMDMMNEFTINNIIFKLKKNLNSEMMSVKMLGEVAERQDNLFAEMMHNIGKFNHNQNEKMKQMVNPDSFYKHLAYSLRLEKENEDFKKANGNHPIGNEIDHPDNFETLYFKRLENEMKKKDTFDYENYPTERKKIIQRNMGKYQETYPTYEEKKLNHAVEISNMNRDEHLKYIRKNQSVSILKKIHESLKEDSGINKDVEEFIKKSEKLRNFKFL